MGSRLIIAIICIMLALIFYTAGVWMEHFKRKLLPRHVVLFCIGLLFDTTGTYIMSTLTGTGNSALLSAHGITGFIAITLMIFHALWAILVLVRKDERMQLKFHRFSIFVWVIWLIPFVLGMIMGMH